MMNPQRRLYIDTSVIGGYHDIEWMEDTRLLWQQAKAGQWQLVTSIVAEAELKNAPANVREVFADMFNAENILDTSNEVEELAFAYLTAAVVPPKFSDDALHVAMATVHGCGSLLVGTLSILSTCGAKMGLMPSTSCTDGRLYVLLAPRRSFMQVRNNQTESDRGFDAVAESRRWKETVAAQTAGMSPSERMAWFRQQSSVKAIRDQSRAVTEKMVLCEEPPAL